MTQQQQLSQVEIDAQLRIRFGSHPKLLSEFPKLSTQARRDLAKVLGIKPNPGHGTSW